MNEIKRVLKPGSILYLDLLLFTAINGDHDPVAQISGKSPPWKHLRSSMSKYHCEPCYVNKVRLKEWESMLIKIFKEVHFVKLDDEIKKNSKYLTNEIKEELNCYSEDELLINTFIAIARK